MKRGIWVLAIAAVIALILSLLVPTLAWIFTGRSIIGSDQLVADYVGTIVAIFSALFSAGVAYIAYLANQDREREHKRRVSAIALKGRLRPVLTAMFTIFDSSVALLGKAGFQAFMGNQTDHSTVFVGVDPAQFSKFVAAWKAAAGVPFDIDLTDAECIAHLDGVALGYLLDSHAHWAEVRVAAQSDLVNNVTATRAGAVLHNVEHALDRALKLNDSLNKIVIDGYESAKVTAISTEAWLKHDNVPLPP